MGTDPRLSRLHRSLEARPYSGRATSLCIRKDNGIRLHPASIQIDRDKGALGDRWLWRTWKHLENGASDPRVQVSLSNSRIIGQLREEKKKPYHPGDNIMVDFDLNGEAFPVGTRFRIGSVVLEVSDVYNDACAKFAGEFGKDVIRWINLPQNRLLNLRGLYARVIEGGKVCLEDRLRLI